MTDRIFESRRSFLKGAGATGVVGVGVLAADRLQLLGAGGGSTLRILGREDDTEYHVAIDRETASKKAADERDMVDYRNGKSLITGFVDADEVDSYSFAGNVLRIDVDDGSHAGFDVHGDIIEGKLGSVRVWKSGAYYFVMTGDVHSAGGVEDDDHVGHDFAQGTVTSDEDRYEANGGVSHVELRATPGRSIALEHSFKEQ